MAYGEKDLWPAQKAEELKALQEAIKENNIAYALSLINDTMTHPEVAKSMIALMLALLMEDQLIEKDVVGKIISGVSDAVPDSVALDWDMPEVSIL